MARHSCTVHLKAPDDDDEFCVGRRNLAGYLDNPRLEAYEALMESGFRDNDFAQFISENWEIHVRGYSSDGEKTVCVSHSVLNADDVFLGGIAHRAVTKHFPALNEEIIEWYIGILSEEVGFEYWARGKEDCVAEYIDRAIERSVYDVSVLEF